MTLKQCTKDDLLWIIDHACKNGGVKIHIQRALSTLALKKEGERLDEADRLAQLIHDKRAEYIKLVKKYQGKPLPPGVLALAVQLTKEVAEAEERWEELMEC